MSDGKRPFLEAQVKQATSCQSDCFRITSGTGWPDKLYAEHGELARMVALWRFVAEDWPRKLPADRLEFVLIALDI